MNLKPRKSFKSPLLRKIQTFGNLSKRQRILFFWVILLSISRCCLKLIGSKKAFAENFKPTTKTTKELTYNQVQLSFDISRAIHFGSKYIPWPNVCRHQSWQAVFLLNHFNIPYTYKVGVKNNIDSTVEGHSWVISGGNFVCGICKESEYIIIFKNYFKRNEDDN